MSKAHRHLISSFFLCLEKDRNGDVLWTWTYPSVEKEFKKLLVKKCPFNTGELDGGKSCFGHFRRNWYHFVTCEVLDTNDALPWVYYSYD